MIYVGLIAIIGCLCVFTNVEGKCGLRRRRGLGVKQDEDRLSPVRMRIPIEILAALISGPRFFIHKSIQAFADAIVKRHGSPNEQAFLFPSHAVASRCTKFFRAQISFVDAKGSLRIIDLYPNESLPDSTETPNHFQTKPITSAVVFPRIHSKIAKTFWQHSGDGISSRRAEYCHKAFDDGHLVDSNVGFRNGEDSAALMKGPRRYQKQPPADPTPMAMKNKVQKNDGPEGKDYVQFVEERFGRNLDVSLAANAKLAIRRRISGALTTANVDIQEALHFSEPSTPTKLIEGFSEEDVYLYPCGMSSIFNTHRTLMACRGEMKSISFGCALS